MAILYSNELKAVVVLEDILETPMNIQKENCLTVQEFDYECIRKRTEKGEIYGAMNPVILSFTVRVNNPLHALQFFKAIATNDANSFTFLFNATYDTNLRLKNYEDGVVCMGFVIGTEEVYNNEINERDLGQQMLMKVKLLVCSLTYMGNEDHNDLKGVFIKKK